MFEESSYMGRPEYFIYFEEILYHLFYYPNLVIRLHVLALSIPLKHLCGLEPTGK